MISIIFFSITQSDIGLDMISNNLIILSDRLIGLIERTCIAAQAVIITLGQLEERNDALMN